MSKGNIENLLERRLDEVEQNHVAMKARIDKMEKLNIERSEIMQGELDKIILRQVPIYDKHMGEGKQTSRGGGRKKSRKRRSKKRRSKKRKSKKRTYRRS